MGKYAATRAVRSKSGSAWKDVGNAAFSPIKSEGDYRFQSWLAGADPTGLYRSYLETRDRTAYMRDYLNNRGLDWSDIKYPTLTMGFSAGYGAGHSAYMLSRNIAKLYM